MAKFGAILSNPIVIIGGVGIGLIALMSRSSAAQAQVQTVGYSPAITSQVVALNTAALGAQSEQLGLQVSLEKSRFAKDIAMQAQTVNYMKNINDNNTRIALERISTSAGVTQTLIQNSTMLTMDILNNNARLVQGAQEIEKTRITTQGAVDIAKAQASGLKVASIANAIGNVAGTAAKIAGG